MTWGTGLAVLGVAALLLGLLAGFTAYKARWAESAVPPQGGFLELDGGRIHFVDRGSGPPLVLIHGLGGTMGNFTHSLIEVLEPDFRVVALDRPAAGHSTRAPGAPGGPLADAEVVAQLIRARGLERPLLVGHSFGGAVALAVAVRHPELVGGVALLAPLTQSQEAPPMVFRAFAIVSRAVRRLAAWTVATPVTMVVRPWALKGIFGPEEVPDDFLTKGGGYLALRPSQFTGTSQDLVAVPLDMEWLVERYGEIQVPTAVLYGADDRILDPELHGQGVIGRIPGVTLELVPGGHMLPVTQAARVAEFVRSVVRRADPSLDRGSP